MINSTSNKQGKTGRYNLRDKAKARRRKAYM